MKETVEKATMSDFYNVFKNVNKSSYKHICKIAGISVNSLGYYLNQKREIPVLILQDLMESYKIWEKENSISSFNHNGVFDIMQAKQYYEGLNSFMSSSEYQSYCQNKKDLIIAEQKKFYKILN